MPSRLTVTATRHQRAPLATVSTCRYTAPPLVGVRVAPSQLTTRAWAPNGCPVANHCSVMLYAACLPVSFNDTPLGVAGAGVLDTVKAAYTANNRVAHVTSRHQRVRDAWSLTSCTSGSGSLCLVGSANHSSSSLCFLHQAMPAVYARIDGGCEHKHTATSRTGGVEERRTP